MIKPALSLKYILAALAAVLLSSSSAFAQSTWTSGGADTNWNTVLNWDNTTVPNSAGAVADLTQTGSPSVHYSGNDTVGIVNIGSSNGAFSVGGENNFLNFNNGASNAQINEVAGAQGGDTWNNTIANLGTVGNPVNLVISNNSSGTGATNTYGVNSNFEFGSGMGQASITGTGDVFLDNNNPNGGLITGGNIPAALNIASGINNTGKIIINGTGTGNTVIKDQIGPNVTELDQNSANPANSKTIFTGGFTGGATTTLKVMAGTLALNNSFEGGQFTGAAQIIVGDTAAHGAASFLDVTQFGNGGTFTTGSSQTISGFGTIIASHTMTTVSGTTIAPGSLGNIGTLAVVNDGNSANGNVSLGGGTNLTFILGQATASPATSLSSLLTVSGTLTLPALTLNLNLSDNADANSQGHLGIGTYELMSYGALSGATGLDLTSKFNINAPLGFTYDVTDTNFSGGAGQIDLVVESAPEPGTWALSSVGLCVLLGSCARRNRRV